MIAPIEKRACIGREPLIEDCAHQKPDVRTSSQKKPQLCHILRVFTAAFKATLTYDNQCSANMAAF
jgi:hypothetical protein